MLKLFGGHELDNAFINFTGSALCFTQPKGFCILFIEFVQAFQQTLGELGTLINGQVQCLIFDCICCHSWIVAPR